MNSDRPVGVAGTGSIGCFVGGMLAAGGHRVAVLARSRLIGEIKANGLRLTGFEGSGRNIAADTLTMSDDPSIFRDAAVVLVTVKSADTADMADIIASHTPDDAVIVSLQNGVGNVAILRERLPGRQVLGAVVPFNVVALGEGASDGRYLCRAGHGRRRCEALGAGLENARHRQDRQPAMGQVDRQPQQRARRAVGPAVTRAACAAPVADADRRPDVGGTDGDQSEGISPVSPTPIPSTWMPPLLRLPDGIFNVLLGRTTQIDPQARSSMSEDLQRGRRTEIDYLQGSSRRLPTGMG